MDFNSEGLKIAYLVKKFTKVRIRAYSTLIRAPDTLIRSNKVQQNHKLYQNFMRIFKKELVFAQSYLKNCLNF